MEYFELKASLVEAGIERLTYAGEEPAIPASLDDLTLNWRHSQGWTHARVMTVTN